MLDRRVVAASLVVSLVSSRAARAAEKCNTNGCYVGVELSQADRIYAAQRQSQWCWAASIQMLFAAGGRSVSQERIVETAYGRQYNLPAFAPVQIASLTNRDWVDENGDTFSSNLVAAYDAFAGVNTMNNDMIIEALAQDQPMVVCNTHHAMLLTAATYIPTPYGPNITNVGFFDPWPGRGLRGPDSLAEGRTTNIGGQITYIGLAEIE